MLRFKILMLMLKISLKSVERFGFYERKYILLTGPFCWFDKLRARRLLTSNQLDWLFEPIIIEEQIHFSSLSLNRLTDLTEIFSVYL